MIAGWVTTAWMLSPGDVRAQNADRIGDKIVKKHTKLQDDRKKQTVTQQEAYLERMRSKIDEAQRKLDAIDESKHKALREAGEVLRVAKLRYEDALNDRDLSIELPKGSAGQLRKLDANDIVKMQVFRIEDIRYEQRAGRKVKVYDKVYTGPAFGVEHPDRAAAIVNLLKNAKAAGRRFGCEAISDHVLVVQPRTGKPFEIPYQGGIRGDFAGFDAPKVKELLHVLSGGRARIAVMHLVDQKIRSTQILGLQTGTRGYYTQLAIHPQKGLGVELKIVDDNRHKVVHETVTLRFCRAQALAGSKGGEGTYVVLLQEP